MSFKKNYLAFVTGGLVLVAVTMVYLKVNYSSKNEANINLNNNSATLSTENNATNASPAIVQEVLASSTISNSTANNASNIVNTPVMDSGNNEETKKLQEEKKSLEEKITKDAKINEEALKKEQEEKKAL